MNIYFAAAIGLGVIWLALWICIRLALQRAQDEQAFQCLSTATSNRIWLCLNGGMSVPFIARLCSVSPATVLAVKRHLQRRTSVRATGEKQ